jgi:deoxycytidylate deaminase
VFHSRPEYYTLINARASYELISPFANENEAKAYAEHVKFPPPPKTGTYTQNQLMDIAQTTAKQSFDYNMQTGVALARIKGDNYELVATSYNGVVPYQTYAMHNGAARERNFSPMHDLNHYDTNHAEVEMIVKAQKHKLDLHAATLFINLLPCPSCARMLTRTDIETFVYHEDHSDGYAVKMLELAGKKVVRFVN